MLKWLHKFFGGKKDELVKESLQASVTEVADEPRPVVASVEAEPLVRLAPMPEPVVASRGADEPVVGSDFVDAAAAVHPAVAGEVLDVPPGTHGSIRPKSDLEPNGVGETTGQSYGWQRVGRPARKPDYRSGQRTHNRD